MEPLMLTEGLRFATQVHGDIPDVSMEDADELPLRSLELVMKASEDALNGFRLVVLKKMSRKPDGGEDGLIEELGKPAAVVSETSRLHELYVT